MRVDASVELTILGGGCAGLSLANYLCGMEQWQKNTLVIEARAHYINDRSWCFWEPQEVRLLHDVNRLITHRWPEWQFSGNQFNTVHHGQGRNYCYIPSDRFYQSALDGINKHPTMQLKQGLSVVSVTAQHNHYLIKLSDETTVLSKQIIDTRPSSYTHSDQAKIWQIFYGIEIQAARPIFDTRCVGLMNHLASSKLGTQFVYILPFSTQHALIEWTVFSPKLSSPHLLEPQLHEWLQSEFGETKMNIIRTEQAVLPMGLKINRPNRDFASSYNYGGQIAGAIRPATGYAFLRIQRWAQACAKQLASDEPIKGHAPSRRIVRAMDDLFLTVLHDEPQKGALLFQALAEHVPPTTLVRFLSDEARILDYALVMNALPAKLFLKYSLSKILGLYRNKVTS